MSTMEEDVELQSVFSIAASTPYCAAYLLQIYKQQHQPTKHNVTAVIIYSTLSMVTSTIGKA